MAQRLDKTPPADVNNGDVSQPDCPCPFCGQHGGAMLPPVLDKEGAARLLYLASGREALKLARQQIIPSVLVGKRVIFITEDVIDALRRRSRPALLDEEIDRT